MRSMMRVLGRWLRHYVRPLVGFWDLFAMIQELRGRLVALEHAAGASRDIGLRNQGLLGEAESGLVARLDGVLANQARLTARGGVLSETLAAEVDRLDDYLLHHAVTLRRIMESGHGALLQRSEALEQGVAALRTDLRPLHNDLLDRTAALELGLAALRAELGVAHGGLNKGLETLLARSHAGLAEGLDALVMAGTFDLIVPTREAGLLAYILRHGTGPIEPGVRAVLLERLRPGATAVDIGANVGLHSLAMAAAVGEGGRVLCFEPLPHLASTLQRTLRLNNFGDRARVEQLALADAPGEAAFHRAAHAPLSSLYPLPEGAAATSLTVRVSTLDECLPPGSRVDVVKIDVEGAEPRVWRGMRRVLAENCDVAVVLEWSASHFARSGEDPDAFMRAIREDGFSVHRIEDSKPAGRLVPVPHGAAGLESANLLLTRTPTPLAPAK